MNVKVSLSSSIIAAAAAYDNLINSCKSLATKIGYTKSLRYFISFLKMRPESESYNKLLQMETLVAETKIRDFILFLKENRSSATVSLYTAGLRKFFDMNRVTLNWKWIRSFEGDKEKQAEDKALYPF